MEKFYKYFDDTISAEDRKKYGDDAELYITLDFFFQNNRFFYSNNNRLSYMLGNSLASNTMDLYLLDLVWSFCMTKDYETHHTKVLVQLHMELSPFFKTLSKYTIKEKKLLITQITDNELYVQNTGKKNIGFTGLVKLENQKDVIIVEESLNSIKKLILNFYNSYLAPYYSDYINNVESPIQKNIIADKFFTNYRDKIEYREAQWLAEVKAKAKAEAKVEFTNKLQEDEFNKESIAYKKYNFWYFGFGVFALALIMAIDVFAIFNNVIIFKLIALALTLIALIITAKYLINNLIKYLENTQFIEWFKKTSIKNFIVVIIVVIIVGIFAFLYYFNPLFTHVINWLQQTGNATPTTNLTNFYKVLPINIPLAIVAYFLLQRSVTASNLSRYYKDLALKYYLLVNDNTSENSVYNKLNDDTRNDLLKIYLTPTDISKNKSKNKLSIQDIKDIKEIVNPNNKTNP